MVAVFGRQSDARPVRLAVAIRAFSVGVRGLVNGDGKVLGMTVGCGCGRGPTERFGTGMELGLPAKACMSRSIDCLLFKGASVRGARKDGSTMSVMGAHALVLSVGTPSATIAAQGLPTSFSVSV